MVHLVNENRDSLLDSNGQKWFYWAFKVDNAAGKTVKFQFDEKFRVGRYGAAVSTDLENWKWVNNSNSESFTYTFSADEDSVYFAHHMLYHPDRFLKLAEELSLEVKTLCKSENGNDVPYVSFGEGNKNIILTARHHACESTGNYVLEGILRQLASNPIEGYRVFCVPFVDYDGVIAGDQGKNRAPHDHNRDYPENYNDSIYNSVKAIRDYTAANNVVYAFDFHSPWHQNDDNDKELIYINNENIKPKLTEFAGLLKNNCSAESLPYTGETYDSFSSDTLANFMLRFNSVELAATLETPFFFAGGNIFSDEKAVNFGKAFAKSLSEYDLQKQN